MTAALSLIVAALATWRLTSLLARERGLFGVGTWLRSCFGVAHEPDGTPSFYEGEVMLNAVTPSPRFDALLHEVAMGMTCVYCCSVWMGALIALLLTVLAPSVVFDAASFALVTLALSAAVIIIEAKLT